MSDIETIKYNRDALASEISRLQNSEDTAVVEEAGHMQSSMNDLDSADAPDGAYIPLLARAQTL